MSRYPQLHNHFLIPNAQSPEGAPSLSSPTKIPETTNTLLAMMAAAPTPNAAATSNQDVATPDAATPDVADTSSPYVPTPNAVTTPTPAPTKPARVHVHVTYTTPSEDMMPLIIATHSFKFNYKAMAALDTHNRTASSLEHRVRLWRKAANQLLGVEEKDDGKARAKAMKITDETGITDGEDDGPSNKGKVVDHKKKRATARKEPVEASPRGRKVVTTKDGVASGQEDGPPSKKVKVTRKRFENVTKGTDEYLPVKKPQTTKKGHLVAKKAVLEEDDENNAPEEGNDMEFD